MSWPNASPSPVWARAIRSVVTPSSCHRPVRGSAGVCLRAGSTRVVVTFEPEDGGTRVTLRHHDLPTDELRDAHRVAWQTYLPRLPVRVAGGDPGPDPHA